MASYRSLTRLELHSEMLKIICPVLLALTFSTAGFSQNYTIQTVAGGAFLENVQANAASFGSQVTGVAVDATGNVYISVPQYFIVVRMNAATGALTLLAGNGTSGYSGDDGPAINAQFTHPGGHRGRYLRQRLYRGR